MTKYIGLTLCGWYNDEQATSQREQVSDSKWDVIEYNVVGSDDVNANLR